MRVIPIQVSIGAERGRLSNQQLLADAIRRVNSGVTLRVTGASRNGAGYPLISVDLCIDWSDYDDVVDELVLEDAIGEPAAGVSWWPATECPFK